ncbi:MULTISPECIES: O-antigen ligase family protein [unclassified Halomonas]|uniref:O-antigen ligase family protein n=1 Tax=unclassified Halomonas TaxID=2609666 RepID=UPI001C956178|nr:MULTISPECIES: O-antigen ligase family protein [unclassified Halomonas]MBY5925418.1 O-antigen ligase family protein [Halomonas sp. DP4Y7-2]MBY6232764.1 O-antigen ligase family protein [Halomonas sp. DP4Y7-1]
MSISVEMNNKENSSTPFGSSFSPRWLGAVLLFITFAYAALRIYIPDIGQKSGTIIAVTALVFILWRGRKLRSSTVFWCLLGVVIAQLISWVAGFYHHPDWLPSNPEIDRLGKWFLFVGVAFWLAGSYFNVKLALSLALLGFLATCFFFDGSLEQWGRGLKGQRIDLDIRNAQHTAMFFGVALIGLLSFVRRCFSGGRLAWLTGTVWVFAFATCLLGVVVTQTRAVWLAMVVVACLAFSILVVAALRGRFSRSARRQVVIAIVSVAALAVIAGISFNDTLKARLVAENTVMAHAIQGNWKEVPYTSIGIRLHTWRAGLEWFSERPILGWGGDGRGLVIDHTEWLPAAIKQHYGHLHNTMLDFLVSYGLLGLSVISVLVVWTGLGSYKSWKAGVMPTEVFVFGCAFFVYYFIVSLFESYSFFWTGSYIQNVVMGVVVTFIWRWQLETGSSVFTFGRKRAAA